MQALAALLQRTRRSLSQTAGDMRTTTRFGKNLIRRMIIAGSRSGFRTVHRSKTGCLLSEMGHSLPRHPIPAATNVRYVSNRWGNRPAMLWIAEDFGCCASG